MKTILLLIFLQIFLGCGDKQIPKVSPCAQIEVSQKVA